MDFESTDQSFDIQFRGAVNFGTRNHSELNERSSADQHPISSITGLTQALANAGKIEKIQRNGTDLPINNKTVNVSVPTSLSQLTDDNDHRTVTDANKQTWNSKYDKPATGIPKSDLSSGVKNSLELADTALQQHQDISGKADVGDSYTKAESDDKYLTEHQSLAAYRTSADQDVIDNTFIPKTQKGSNNGVAELDSTGKVPSSQLPSYVDDVLEYDTRSLFPAVGESGKIYIAIDSNLQYRWTGTQYAEISSSLALGETSSTAYRGDRGKVAYDHSQDATVHVTSSKKTEWDSKLDEEDIEYAIFYDEDATASGQTAVTQAQLALKQNVTDNTLATTSKTVVGAINELNLVKGTYSKPEGGIPSSDLASGVIPDISGLQEKLIAGTNITIASDGKTISATGGSEEPFIATYGVTAFSEIESAISAGRRVFARYNNSFILPLAGYIPNIYAYFSMDIGESGSWSRIIISVDLSDDWNNQSHQLTTVINYESTDLDFPSAKAVYDAVSPKYTKPASGIPSSDLASGVIPDITGKQDKTDNTLTTTAKTVVGAVNELKSETANKIDKPTVQIPANYVPTSDGQGGYTWAVQQASATGTVNITTSPATAGVLVTLTNTSTSPSATFTGTTDSLGQVTIAVNIFGVFTISCTKTGITAVDVPDTFTVYAGNTKNINCNLYFGSTYTVKINTANSNPITCIEYQDGAVGMTKGSDDWDDKEIFAQIRPCLLNNGKITYLKKNNFNYDVNGHQVALDGTQGDVMIEVPKFAYRIYKDNGYLYVSISNKASDIAQDNRYHYYAFSKSSEGDLEKFYISAYKGSLDNHDALRSISGATPANNKTISAFKACAKTNGDNYTINSYFQLVALQCLYIIKYGNLNSQAALGRGDVWTSDAIATGGTEDKGMYWGDTSGSTSHVKFAGIEDFWGNRWEWIDGITTDSGYNIITNWHYDNKTAETNFTFTTGLTSNYLAYFKDVSGTTESGFIGYVSEGSESTYYCDVARLSSSCVAIFGGSWNNHNDAGAFCLWPNDAASVANPYIGARLLYLPNPSN